MVDVTLFELHLEDSPFDLNLPFSGGSAGEDDRAVPVADSDSSRRGKVAAIAGLILVAVVVAGLAKRRSGDDEEVPPDVGIETADDEPIGVAVDE